jgi:hypothetical protein
MEVAINRYNLPTNADGAARPPHAETQINGREDSTVNDASGQIIRYIFDSYLRKFHGGYSHI